MTKLNILGSTGIIGKKALNIINKDFSNYSINFLMANNNYKLLSKQANQFKPKYIGLLNEKNYIKLKNNLDNKNIKIVTGNECYQILNKSVDSTLVSISGISALKSIISSIKNSKKIGIVNKESIVSAGKFIIPLAKKSKTKIIPLDSEHFSIYNFLLNYNKDVSYIDKIYLTASGGPFLYTNIKKFKNIKPADALKHPTWKMGIKNTIDSSTMMNKGLEYIEAKWLFGVNTDVEIIVHAQSIIHSMIEFVDTSVIAQLGIPDMRVPIAYALTYPERFVSKLPSLDLASISDLSFEAPDLERFPCLQLAMDAMEIGETMPAVLNAANEIAVQAFLDEQIPFKEISEIIRMVMHSHHPVPLKELKNVLDADLWAREESAKLIAVPH